MDALFVRSRLQELMKSVLLCFLRELKSVKLKKDIKKILDVDSGLGYTSNTDIMNVLKDIIKIFMRLMLEMTLYINKFCVISYESFLYNY